MGCCCPSEKSKTLTESVVGEEVAKDRLEITGSTNLTVENRQLQEVDSDTYIIAVDTRGKIHNKALLDKFNIREQHTNLLREENGQLEVGKLYPIQQVKNFILLPLPLWKGGHNNEITILESILFDLVGWLKSQRIPSICLDALGVKYFGFPRQVMADILVKAFGQFFQSDTTLKSISFVSPDIFCVHHFEVKMKTLVPQKEIIKEGKQVDDKPQRAASYLSELEKPLLEDR
ncbi:hypothetical protein pb186bvf_019240 [Paramecium bursaria]